MEDNWDFISESQKIALQKAMAQRLQPKELNGGQMVDGWYVPTSKGAVYGNIFQNALSGLMEGKNSRDEAEMNSKDRAAYDKAMAGLLNPDRERFEAEAKARSPIPQEQYTYRDPASVGPMDPDAAQSFPVNSPPLPQPTGNMQPMEAGPAPRNVQPDPQALAKLQQPQGLIETPPSGDGPLARAIPSQGQDFNVQQPDPAAVASAQAQQQQYLQRALEAQRMQSMGALGRTRDGAPLAKALQQQQLMNQLSPKWDTKALKNPDGSERLIQVAQNGQVRTLDKGTDGSVPPSVALQQNEFAYKQSQDAAKKAAEQKELANTATTQLAQVGNARKQISSLLNPSQGQAGIRDANGVTGKLGSALTSVTGIATKSADARAKIEGLKGSLMATFMSNTKALAGTAAGMSEKESSAGAASIGAINPDMSSEALERSLRDIDTVFADQEDRIKRHASSMGATAGGSAPAGGLNAQQQSVYSNIFGKR